MSVEDLIEKNKEKAERKNKSSRRTCRTYQRNGCRLITKSIKSLQRRMCLRKDEKEKERKLEQARKNASNANQEVWRQRQTW